MGTLVRAVVRVVRHVALVCIENVPLGVLHTRHADQLAQCFEQRAAREHEREGAMCLHTGSAWYLQDDHMACRRSGGPVHGASVQFGYLGHFVPKCSAHDRSASPVLQGLPVQRCSRCGTHAGCLRADYAACTAVRRQTLMDSSARSLTISARPWPPTSPFSNCVTVKSLASSAG